MDKNKIKSYLSSNFLTEAKDTAEKPAGLKKTEDIQNANKAINKAAMSDVEKVVKANDKALESNKTTNAKEVKKRELDKNEQETHDNVELFQDTMLALDYDSPVDDKFKDRFEKSLAGHATMGNSNEYANVVQDKVWGGDPKFGQSLVNKTKAMSKVQQNVVGGGNAMLPYGVHNGNLAMNENNNMDKKDKMKRLVFKKPFNGLSNALNLIPESYRVDDKEFEMTDGNESYKVRWEGTLTEGRAIVLMGSSKEQVNEDIAKIKHLMGYSSEKSLGTLKGNQRLDENKRFSDIWGKSKSLLSESYMQEDEMNELTAKQDKIFNMNKEKGNEEGFTKKDFEALRNSKNLEEMNQAQGGQEQPQSKDVENFFTKFDQNGSLQALFGRIDKKDEVIDFMTGVFEAILSKHQELSSVIGLLMPELKAVAQEAKAQAQGTPGVTEGNYMEEGTYEEYDRLEEIFGGMDEEGEKNTEPTKEEMYNFLKQNFGGYGDDIEFDIAEAIYWFAYSYHGGQWSNLYSVLSTSDYKPSPLMKGIENSDSELSKEMYNALESKFA